MRTRTCVKSVVTVGLVFLVAPAVALACPICFGLETGSDEAQSLNWAVFTLLGVTGGVLSGFVGFMLHLVKRSRQALGQDETSDPTPPTRPGGRW